MEVKRGRGPDFKSAERFAADLDRLTTRMDDRFQKASAKGLRKMLPAGFDPDLLAEIDVLIPVRDRLAHRYPFEKLVPGPPGSPFQPGTERELRELGTRFGATATKLNDRTLARLAELPERQAPPEMREAIEGRVRAIVLGEFE
jgi:hypothetical protein